MGVPGSIAWYYSSWGENTRWIGFDSVDFAVGLERGGLWIGRTGTPHAARYACGRKDWALWETGFDDYPLSSRVISGPCRDDFVLGWRVGVPLWPAIFVDAVALGTALILSIILLRRWATTPRPGHCPCGYNLTGNVSGRCPECGQIIANSTAGAARGLAES